MRIAFTFALLLGLLSAPVSHSFFTKPSQVSAQTTPAGCSTLSFRTAPHTAVAVTTINDVAAGDYNGDGNPDAVVAHPQGIVFLAGDGKGEFLNPIPLAVTGEPQKLFKGDFNGDGKPDFLAAGTSANVLLLNTGGGNFQPVAFTALESAAARLVAIGDFNGDKRSDLLVILGANATSKLAVMLNTSGGFLLGAELSTGGYWNAVAGDFNSDGRDDVAFYGGTLGGTSDYGLRWSNADGSFRLQQYSTGEGGISGMVAGDFDGDGRREFAFSTKNGSHLGKSYVILANRPSGLTPNGGGNFIECSSYYAEGSAYLDNFPPVIAVGDINGDGNDDLAFHQGCSGNLTLVSGFMNDSIIGGAYGVSGRLFDTADFNRDGRADFLFQSQLKAGQSAQFTKMLSRSTGGYDTAVSGGSGGAVLLTSGDYSRTGKSEFARVRPLRNLGVYEIDVNRNIGGSVSAVYNLLSKDINRDGFTELISIYRTYAESPNKDRIKVGGTLQPDDVPFSPSSVRGTADINDDGYEDLILSYAPLTVVYNNGASLFLTRQTFAEVNLARIFFLNDDGFLDWIVNLPGGKELWLGNGNGTFRKTRLPVELEQLASSPFADFTGDGKLDLLVFGSNGTHSILPGVGNGEFGAALPVAAEQLSQWVTAVDLNGDNLAELVSGDGSGARVWQNLGAGRFARPIIIEVESGIGSLGAGGFQIGDFDGDGKPDLAFSKGGWSFYVVYNSTACNQPHQLPTITPAAALAHERGSAARTLRLASLSFGSEPMSSYQVTTQVPASVGLTISNLKNTNGLIQANVAVACNALVGLTHIELLITAANGSTQRQFIPLRVMPNIRPSLEYAPLWNQGSNGNYLRSLRFPVMDSGTFTFVLRAPTLPGARVANTGVVTVPAVSPIGTHQLFVTVTDDCGAASTVELELQVINSAPIIAPISALTRQQGSVAESFTNAPGNDSATPAEQWTVRTTNVPAGLTVTNLTNTNGAITAKVAAACGAAVGAYVIELSASDGTSVATTNVTVNVTANTPPTLGRYANVTLRTGDRLFLSSSAAPRDDGILTITASAQGLSPSGLGLAGPLEVDARTGAISHRQLNNPDTYTVTVTATDNCSATTQTSFQLTVTRLPTSLGFTVTPLVVNATGEMFIFRGYPSALEGNAFSLPGGGVTFSDESGEIVRAEVNPSRGFFAEITIPYTKTGRQIIKARYSGDIDREPATGTPLTLSINPAATAVSAANYRGEQVAPNQIISLFGSNFATRSEAASTTLLPTTLAGVQVLYADANNQYQPMPLFFAAPGQINLLLTAPVPVGYFVPFEVRRGETVLAAGKFNIAALAPGLFAADATGKGFAAAQVLRVLSDGTQRYEPIARYDQASQQFVAVPIDLSNASEQVFLVLYGTGLRGRSALANVTTTVGGTAVETLFAGAQGSLVGLDQVNVRLPRSLAGRGEVDVAFTADGKAANAVRINLR